MLGDQSTVGEVSGNISLEAYRTTRCIRHYAYYIITIFGVASNIITLVVLGFSKRMRRSGSGFFLIALAIADTAVLITQFLGKLLRSEDALYETNQSCPTTSEMIVADTNICTSVLYLKYAFRCIATLIVMFISIHRYAVVTFPLSNRLHAITTRKAVAIQVTVITIFAFIATIYVFEMTPYLEGCMPGDTEAYQIGVTIVDVILCDVIASLLITVLSALTVVSFIKSGKLLASENSETNPARKRGERHMTVLLLSVAITFVVTRLPYAVTWTPLWFTSISGYSKYVSLSAATNILECVSLLNHAIHLYVYCVFSRSFREEIRQLCPKKLPVSMGTDRQVRRPSRATLGTKSSTLSSEEQHNGIEMKETPVNR